MIQERMSFEVDAVQGPISVGRYILRYKLLNQVTVGWFEGVAKRSLLTAKALGEEVVLASR